MRCGLSEGVSIRQRFARVKPSGRAAGRAIRGGLAADVRQANYGDEQR